MNGTYLSDNDSQFLAYLRGIAILVIVFGHTGGFWVFRPYTEFLHVFVPVFFFLSGAVSYYSYLRSKGTLEYLRKRVVGLLVPYYLLCIVWLIVFVAVNKHFPQMSLQDVFAWITVRPVCDASKLSWGLGHVWFLHTLLIILLVSPAYFWLYRNKPWIFAELLALPMALAAVQTVYDIHNYFCLAGNNLFKPIVHSVFFSLGFLLFSSDALRRIPFLAGMAAASLLLSAALLVGLDLNPGYDFRTYSPDLYYVAGSLAAIAGLVAMQRATLGLCRRVAAIAHLLKFMHRYTFPIYLLHGLAIFFVEEVFGLVHPQSNVIWYGIAKFSLVLVMTSIMAVPFGSLSDWLTKRTTASPRLLSQTS